MSDESLFFFEWTKRLLSTICQLVSRLLNASPIMQLPCVGGTVYGHLKALCLRS